MCHFLAKHLTLNFQISLTKYVHEAECKIIGKWILLIGLYREIFWGPAANCLAASARRTCSSHQLFPHVLAQSQTNHKQNQPRLTEDAKNGPCCYAHIPCTSVKCSHSYYKVLSANVKPETLNPYPLWMASKGFSRGMFKPHTNSKPFLFNERSAFSFFSNFPSNNPA
jgi:hypothetical protein